MSDRQGRNGGIDFLRCIAMFAIVIYHCCWYGAYLLDDKVVALGCLTGFAVDCFAFISGWFAIRFSLRKVLRLLYIGMFAAVSVWLFDGCRAFSFSLGWYGNCYLALLLLSPLVNEGVDKICGQVDELRAWAVVGVPLLLISLCSWLPLEEIGINLRPVGISNCSLFTLIYMYCLGRICAKLNLHQRFTRTGCSIMLILAVLVSIGWSVLLRGCQGFWGRVKIWDNLSPMTVLIAIFFFFAFIKIPFPRWALLAAKSAAPSMFTVYLLHDGAGGRIVRPLIVRMEESYGQSFGSVASVMIVASVVFFGCFGVDIFRRVVEMLARYVVGAFKTGDNIKG